ncbi:hypothetical protein ACLB2K_058974 [Fragaria x ananassa]
MYSHLALYGICSSYTVWTWHGKTQVQIPTLTEIQAQQNQQAGSSNASYEDPAVINLLNDAFSFAASGYQENVVYDNVPDTSPNVSHVDYSRDYDKYNRLVREVHSPLYPDSEHTLLGTVMEQMTIKNKRGKTNKCFDENMALMKKVLLKGNSCLADYDEVKTMLADLGLEVQKIDACVNNCMLYYKENEAEDECRHCYEPRFHAWTLTFLCLSFFPLPSSSSLCLSFFFPLSISFFFRSLCLTFFFPLPLLLLLLIPLPHLLLPYASPSSSPPATPWRLLCQRSPRAFSASGLCAPSLPADSVHLHDGGLCALLYQRSPGAFCASGLRALRCQRSPRALSARGLRVPSVPADSAPFVASGVRAPYQPANSARLLC